MAKLAQTSVKYVIKAKFDAEGTVERPDVIGALFGQTEGLLGIDMDLRELQRTGKVGRVDVKIYTKNGKSEGDIMIPSSLDSTETTLIAATLETIERVGPCDAKIRIDSIEDLRSVKRKYIIDRAKALLSSLIRDLPDTNVVTEELKQAVRTSEITEYMGFAAGPDVVTSNSIIVVEGRADVINLLRQGANNAIALGGTSIPKEIVRLSKEKEMTVFLDGDRGGDLILKELKQVADIDFIARAPNGKEVEELTKKEIFKALRDRIPAEQGTKIENNDLKEEPQKIPFERPKLIKRSIDEDLRNLLKKESESLIGSHAASIIDKNLAFCGRVSIQELNKAIKQVKDPYVVVIDGYIDLKLLKLAEGLGIKYLVGSNKKRYLKSKALQILTQEEL